MQTKKGKIICFVDLTNKTGRNLQWWNHLELLISTLMSDNKGRNVLVCLRYYADHRLIIKGNKK